MFKHIPYLQYTVDVDRGADDIGCSGFEPVLCVGDVFSMHRRRIYLEDKAKVVMLDWGTESLPC